MTSVTTSPVQVETEANKAACQAFFAGRYGGRHSSRLGDRNRLWPSGSKHVSHIAYDDIFVRLEGRPSTRHQIAAATVQDFRHGKKLRWWPRFTGFGGSDHLAKPIRHKIDCHGKNLFTRFYRRK